MMIKLDMNKEELKMYSEKYNGTMVCSCGCVGCYFNIGDDFRWWVHKLFCKEVAIRSPKEIRKLMYGEMTKEDKLNKEDWGDGRI